jgi:acyl-CoA reductase-like NAD-dependent aldehyde dehydrogenase
MARDLQEIAKQIADKNFPVNWPGHLIDNEWREIKKGSPIKASFNPNNNQKLIEVCGDKESVLLAIESAVNERKKIAGIPIDQRLALLKRFRQVLADYRDCAESILRLEAGKPKWEAQSDLESALEYMEWVASNGELVIKNLITPTHFGVGKGSYELLPIGVTAAYLPFSTPVTSFALYFSASLLAGCPLILNSSSHSLLFSLLVAGITRELDLPKGLLNIVFGNFNTFKYLISDRRVVAMLYTGSREHCDAIRLESKSHLGRQLILQSGGKNSVIVHSSADLEHAVKCVIYGALKSAGQRCTSTSRVFVYRSMLTEFKERIVAAVRSVKIGRTDVDHQNEADYPFMGPLYSEKSVEKFLRFQTMANRESDTLSWGKVIESETHGNFVTPGVHMAKKFDNKTAYQGNVLFSPDIAIYDYDVLDDAIDCINTTDAAFGVSFIGDPEIITSRRDLFLAPNLFVNTPTVEMDAAVPLAGRLQSGHHRFHGPGIVLYLCYPQVLSSNPGNEALIKSWPWPGK